MSRRSESIKVSLYPAEKDALERAAQRLGTSQASVLRYGLRTVLDRAGIDADRPDDAPDLEGDNQSRPEADGDEAAGSGGVSAPSADDLREQMGGGGDGVGADGSDESSTEDGRGVLDRVLFGTD